VTRPSRPALAAALLLSAWLVLLPASPAAPHAIVLESSPAHDAVLERAPEQMTLRFNSKIEKRFTRITLAPGVYVLRYRVLAVDGHITEGALRFTVGPAR